jgi:thioesterase domain-containing protein/aryl carrier-like protein
MIPALWLSMESIPLTSNGKVDKRKLPAVDAGELLSGQYVAPCNQTESVLAEIWQDLLGVDRVGIHDNFFELGGHSITTIQMASRIRKLGFKIKLKDIFKYQTIDKQYKWLNTVEENDEENINGQVEGINQIKHEHIKILNYGNIETPMFIVPGSPGFIEPYEELAQSFKSMCMVYGIPMTGLKADEEPLDNIDEIAALNKKWVKEIQPEGPYRFIGHSLGAYTVFEMARQLELEGEIVELIIVLDKSAYEPKPTDAKERINIIKEVILETLKTYNLNNYIQPSYIDNLLNELTSYDLTNLKKLATFCTDYLRRQLENQKTNIDLVMRIIKLQIIHHLMEYIPNDKIRANMLIIKASEADWSMTDNLLGWLKHSDNVYSTISNGNHGNMIDQPNVSPLADQIKNVLKELTIVSS